jgi:hypothetical protein
VGSGDLREASRGRVDPARREPFALALSLAGAEPEALATAVTASLRDAPAITFGDVIAP